MAPDIENRGIDEIYIDLTALVEAVEGEGRGDTAGRRGVPQACGAWEEDLLAGGSSRGIGKAGLTAAIRSASSILLTGDRTHFGRWYGKSFQDVTVHSPLSLAELFKLAN